MPLNIFPVKRLALSALSVISVLSVVTLSGCVLCKKTVEPLPRPAEQNATIILQDETTRLGLSLPGIKRDISLRKVRFATLHAQERRSVQRGEDLLRIGRYDEEVLTLPKVRASRDFHIYLQDDNSTFVINGYSNVTYERLRSKVLDSPVLIGGIVGTLDPSGRLEEEFYLPAEEQGRYESVTGRIAPEQVFFKQIQRTRVLPETEEQYVLRYLGKQGMQLEFELRRLKGGSRPRVISREKIAVPLGSPHAEVAGHVFKIHTATTDFLDVTMIK